MLIQLVVRHGETVIFHNVETEEDGQTMDVNVAQYVYYDLSGDQLEFSNPLYQRILQEAVTHSGDEDFKTENYFNHHPDFEVSSLAARLTADDGIFTKHLQLEPTEEYLRNMAQHLVLDFKQNWVEQRLLSLKRELSLAVGDQEKLTQVLKDIKEMSDLRNLIGSKVGRRVAR